MATIVNEITMKLVGSFISIKLCINLICIIRMFDVTIALKSHIFVICIWYRYEESVVDLRN